MGCKLRHYSSIVLLATPLPLLQFLQQYDITDHKAYFKHDYWWLIKILKRVSCTNSIITQVYISYKKASLLLYDHPLKITWYRVLKVLFISRNIKYPRNSQTIMGETEFLGQGQCIHLESPACSRLPISEQAFNKCFLNEDIDKFST